MARFRVTSYEMDRHAFRLTQQRAVQESDGGTPGPATSIFKMYGSELRQEFYELMTRMRGSRGFSMDTADRVRRRTGDHPRLAGKSRAVSIYSGSNEIQRNIIAKRVLGLPD